MMRYNYFLSYFKKYLKIFIDLPKCICCSSFSPQCQYAIRKDLFYQMWINTIFLCKEKVDFLPFDQIDSIDE